MSTSSLTDADSKQVAQLAKIFKIASIYTAILAFVNAGLLILGFHLIPGILPPGGFRTPLDYESIFLVAMVVFGFIVALGFAALLYYAGTRVSKLQGYWFCMVMSVLSLGIFPVGPLLTYFGVTILTRPTVKSSFAPAANTRT